MSSIGKPLSRSLVFFGLINVFLFISCNIFTNRKWTFFASPDGNSLYGTFLIMKINRLSCDEEKEGKVVSSCYSQFINIDWDQSAALSVILTQDRTTFLLSCRRYRSQVYSDPTVLYLYSILPPNYDTINLITFPVSFQISSLLRAQGTVWKVLCRREDWRN